MEYSNHSNMLLPTMDAPPSVEWGNMERIQQIYSELPSIFAKEISRRHQMGVIPTIAPPLMSNGGTLKRDRSEELSGDIAMKRRNTGDSKPSASMPPPSIPLTTPMNPSTPNQFPLSIPNGVGPSPLTPGPPHLSPPHSEAQIASLNPGLLTNPSEAQLAAHNRERARQVQIRAAQQQQAARQMSPPSSIPQGGMMTNAVAGPSNPGGMGGMGGMGAGRMPDSSAQQQFLQVLGQPSHPFMQYMLRNVPNFEQFPVQQQVQKMMMVQAQLRQQQQNQGQGSLGQMSHMAKNPMQQISLQMPGMGSQGGHNASLPSNGAFPGGGMGAHPGSPIPPQSPMVPQSANMFGMDNLGGQSGGIGAGPIGGGGGGGGGGMDMRGGGMANNINLNNLTPTQRQQLMMMQQSQFRGNTPGGGGGQMPGGGGGGGGGPMMLNQQQQLSMREQQQRMIQAHAQQQQQQQAGSPPTHPGSPMSGDPTFPALRSNPSIPGIARSTRSPSDGAVSPMTPRVPTRGGAQDDYQRMMQAQQQMQARGMSAGSPVYNPQQQQQQQTQQMGVTGTGWQGNQHQGMQMGLGQQQQGGGASSGYGMSPPPGSAGSHGGMPFSGGGGGGGMNAPSPSSSQNWGSSQSGHGNYPFSPSPGSAHQPPDHSMQMQQQQLRHMSGTPGPQQMQMQMQPQNMGAMPEQSMPTEFDLFNWNGQ
ncbi:hypothetical protein H0H87_006854 [Tephrocybe sp. NHM501043]|nr:hypothetical protein H0H87_006854 [Tephrocybe sp. NHM501043]